MGKSEFANSNFPMLDEQDDYEYCPNWKFAHYNIARLGPKYYPIDIYRKFENHREKRQARYMAAAGAAFMGVVVISLSNLATRKPPYSSMWKHVLTACSFGTVSWLFSDYKIRSTAATESRYIMFMESNPELFPPMERIKVGDVGVTQLYNEGLYTVTKA